MAMRAGTRTAQMWSGPASSLGCVAGALARAVTTCRSRGSCRGCDPAQHRAPHALSRVDAKPVDEQRPCFSAVAVVQLEHEERRPCTREAGIAGDRSEEPSGGDRGVAGPEGVDGGVVEQIRLV